MLISYSFHSSDSQARAIREKASGLWRDEAAQGQAINATDDSHARKKRKVDDLLSETAPSAPSSSVTSSAVVQSQDTHLVQGPGGRPINSSQTTKAAPTGQSTRQGPSGQGTRPPLQSQESQSSQTDQQANTQFNLQRPSQPRQTSSTQLRQSAPASAADDVVIADVETAPPTRLPNASMSSATPSSAVAAIDKSKKAVKRPAPLVNVATPGNGIAMNHPPTQKSARSVAVASGLVELDSSLPTGIANVSPVVSGFPMHTADKATLESVSSELTLILRNLLNSPPTRQFRFALQIKDQQRDLIEKRLAGKIPQEFDQPGTGPPPSAGPIPPMMYLHKNSVGSRRSEAVKQKVQGMRVSTSTEGYRQNGTQASLASPITDSLLTVMP